MTDKTHNGSGPDSESVRRWNGVYLGRVVQTRAADLWVRVSVPQLHGDKQVSNWARPAGFNSAGDANPPVANIMNDGQGADEDRVPLGWGGFADSQTGAARPVGFGVEKGPGPPPGTLVLIMFIGGDNTQPCYLLTSQMAST